MDGNVVVVTGASSGIGAALAVEIARRGGVPVLAARRERELGAARRAAGEAALSVVADVTRREDNARIVETALAARGRIDAWVNNAGRGISRPVTELTDDDLDEMFLLNTKAPLYGVQAVLPVFRKQGRGHVVNVSSMLGKVPFAGIRSAYSAAKAALGSLTANLRMELRETDPGIAVTLVLPGVVATDFGNRALHGGPDSRSLPAAQPVEEVAAVIADALEHPRAEVYTRPGLHEQAAAYHAAEDVAEVEARFRGPGPR